VPRTRYSWARYYHPGPGRFLSEDPIDFEGGELNLYAYVGNDPVNFSDPLGYAKGGPQNVNVNLPDGRTITKKTPAQQIQQIIKDAQKLGLSPKQVQNLKRLLKVVKRGGTLGLIWELIDPDPANAGEDDLPKVCPAGLGACGPSGSKSSQ
jgi:uncharacterized protein RhaS with RHS repeats